MESSVSVVARMALMPYMKCSARWLRIPAAIKRFCRMPTSVGFTGTMSPILASMSRKLSEGSRTEFCAISTSPITRSTAVWGCTQNLKPTTLSSAVMIKNNIMEANSAVIVLS